MKDSIEQFRIGKLAQELGVERFVIRFWEKEFHISAQRSSGGQRFYNQKDFEQFKLIKELLYEKGFTIAGAKKIIKEQPKKSPVIEFSSNNTKININEHQNLLQKIIALKKQLMKLHELL
ncbi:MAG: MerR family transcriptional regulator [Candidatus Babeliales bacterium]